MEGHFASNLESFSTVEGARESQERNLRKSEWLLAGHLSVGSGFSTTSMSTTTKEQTIDKKGLPMTMTRTPSQEQSTNWRAIGMSCGGVLLVVACFIIVVAWRRLKMAHTQQLDSEWQFDPERSVQDQLPELSYNLQFEFPRLDVSLKGLIGEGNFSQVWEATAEGVTAFKPRDCSELTLRSKLANIHAREQCNDFWVKYFRLLYYQPKYSLEGQVAVKCLKPVARKVDYIALANELEILIQIGNHKNIVNLVGVCTQRGPFWVMVEFCPHGDLKQYLNRKRLSPTWNRLGLELTDQLNFLDLSRMAMEIAEAMTYLSLNGIIHRDLACRNILVGKNLEIKVADFGMAQNVGTLGEENDYRYSVKDIPVRWTAPEALNTGIHSISSDVWSYGIVLWEMFSMGRKPYAGKSNFDVKLFIEMGGYLDLPMYCPHSFYVVMKACWNKDQHRRPSFSDIFEILFEIKRNVFAPRTDYYTGDIYTTDAFMECGPVSREKQIDWLENSGMIVTDENAEELLEHIWGAPSCTDDIDAERDMAVAGPSRTNEEIVLYCVQDNTGYEHDNDAEAESSL